MESYQNASHLLRLEESIAKKLRTKDESIARMDKEIFEKTQIITTQENAIAEKDVEISNLKAQLDASHLLVRNQKIKFSQLKRKFQRILAKNRKRISNLQQGQQRLDQLLTSKRNTSKSLRNENIRLRQKWLRCKSELEKQTKKKSVSELNLQRIETALDNSFPHSSSDENHSNDATDVHSDSDESDDSMGEMEVEGAAILPSEIVEVQMETSRNQGLSATPNAPSVSRSESEVDGPIRPETVPNPAHLLQHLSLMNAINTLAAATPNPAQGGLSSSSPLQFCEEHVKDSSRTVVGRYYCKCNKDKLFKCEHNLNKHIGRNKHRNFGCPHCDCDRRFHSLFEANKHLLKAHGIPFDRGIPTGCSPCGRKFESRSEYAMHYWEMHKVLHGTSHGSASEADRFYQNYEASFRNVNYNSNEEIYECNH